MHAFKKIRDMEYSGTYNKEGVQSQSEIPIFIVDDDPSYLYSLGFHLKKEAHCKIYCYDSGKECLKNLHLHPAIVILDYYLNAKNHNAPNGLEVLKKIKKAIPSAQVIILSAQHTLQIAVTSLTLGAYTYVIKDAHAHSSIMRIVNVLTAELIKKF
jgi:DNA-binding NarL/FixJ family response regulator